jgi:methylase of polypeptide subunit release factors
MTNTKEYYILATGGKDVKRLRLLHEVYGPGTEALFHRVGLLRGGLRVVEIGCGSGNIACWVAERIAPSGSVMAIDVSPEQIEQARLQAERRELGVSKPPVARQFQALTTHQANSWGE